MTAPKPSAFGSMVITTSTKAPTAVDGQRDEFLACWSDPHPGVPADEADDATLAFHGDLDRLLAAARAEAVAPVLAVLRQLVAACHKCANCESPAMRKAANEALYCDAHGYYLSGTQMDDHRIAAPLRAALALLAADQAGEKAGKP